MPTTRPEPAWLSIGAYCRKYSLSRSTFYAFERDALVLLVRLSRPSRVQPLVRVRNRPPLGWTAPTS